MKRSLALASLICGLSCADPRAAESGESAPRGKAEHIVIVVWDGMRPDFIRPQYAPALYQLARGGVFFKNHHALYISSTEVNGTGLATGVYPDRSGIMSNSDYRPEIGWLGPQGTESLEAVRRGDWLTEGNYLQVPTLAEILQRNGHRTIVAGTKAVALLSDRSLKRNSQTASNSVTLYRGHAIPSSVLPSLVKVNDDKAFATNVTHPNLTQDAWTTKALTHGLWKKGVPKFTLLWLSEPDASQHETGPGSEVSIAAIESSDKNLAEVLKTLDEKKVLEKTDVFVVSDHGFSTIFRGPDVVELLKKAKFKATRRFEDPEPGDVLVVGLGGSMLLYVIEHEAEVVRRLVDYFQTTDFTGVIFSRTPLEGTFPLDLAHIDTTNAPDLVVSFRWTADKNDFGTPGMVIGENGKKGKGTHASLSHYDLNNTLVAAGPDFRQGFINELPTGNADLVPTILWLLGVTPPQPLDGRVMTEALAGGSGEALKPEQKTVEATRDLGLLRWRQYLKFTTVGKAIYFDEGDGESVVK